MISADEKCIMGILEKEFESSRIVGETLPSIVDLPLINVLSRNLVSVCAWYDNEAGSASRLAETAWKITL